MTHKPARPQPPEIRITGIAKPADRPTASYDVIDRDIGLTKTIPPEKASEDATLTPPKRRRMTALMRDSMRNSPTVGTIVLQHDLNVVGSVGGIMQLTTDDRDYNRAAARAFGRWARRCEWTYGESLNDILSNVVRCLDLTGDCILIHDAPAMAGALDAASPDAPEAAPLVNSGKLRVVESDEIVSCSDEAHLATVYGVADPSLIRQSHGLVYDDIGRLIGAVVSPRSRGKDSAPPADCIFLHRDPDAPLHDCSWIIIRASWRPNQGRGISPLAPSSGSLSNIDTIITSETASVRAAAQTVAVVKYDRAALAADAIPAAYQVQPIPAVDPAASVAVTAGNPADPLAPFAGDPAEAEEPRIRQIVEPAPPHAANVDLDVSEIERAKGTRHLALPSGVEYQEFSSSHPNLDISAFCRHLAADAAHLLGMGDQYATLTPQGSYSAYRGSVVMARPAFRRLQKILERQLLDWIGVRVLANAAASGDLPLPAGLSLFDLADALEWKWPKPLEANAVDAENATRLALQNGTATYRDILGPDWESIIAQRGLERRKLAEHGLVDPMAQTLSGAPLPVDGADPADPSTH